MAGTDMPLQPRSPSFALRMVSRLYSRHYPSSGDYMGDPIESPGWHGVARTGHAAAGYGSIYDHMTLAGICTALAAGPLFRE